MGGAGHLSRWVRSRTDRRVLIAALSTDLLLITLFLASRIDRLGLCDRWNCQWLSLAHDYSLPSIFLFFKFAGTTVLLLLAAKRQDQKAYTNMAIVFFIVLMDDLLRIHERGGNVLADYFGGRGALGLRAQDFGEIAVWAMLGIIVVLIIAGGYRNSHAPGRAVFQRYCILLVLLIIAAVGLDLVHSLANQMLSGAVSPIAGMIGLVEDGSELLLGSVLLAMATRDSMAA